MYNCIINIIYNSLYLPTTNHILPREVQTPQGTTRICGDKMFDCRF